MLLDIYKGLWVTLFGPRSVSTTQAENPLVINDDGSVNVTVIETGVAAVDGSSTITLGNTAQNLFSGSTPSNGFGIYNPDSSQDLWMSLSTTAVANGTGCIRIVANGGWYETPINMKPFHAISIVGGVTGQKFTAVQW